MFYTEGRRLRSLPVEDLSDTPRDMGTFPGKPNRVTWDPIRRQYIVGTPDGVYTLSPETRTPEK